MVQWNNSKKNYGLLSKKAVVGKGSTSLFQLIWAVSIVSGIGLIYGNLLGAALAMVLVTYPYIRQMKTFLYSFAELKAVALKHYRYAIYTAPQNVLNAVSQGLPVLMLGRFFGDVEVGAYFFTMRILQLPSALIGGAVRQVFYKEAADLKSDLKALRNKFQKVTLLLFAGILVPIIVMFFTGPALFSFVFGEEWREAGVYASWMFMWVGLMFVNPPASAMYFILNKQSKQLIYEVALFAARFAALFHFGQTQDILLTIQVYSCIGVFFNIVYITYISIVLRNESLNRG
jgi:O-antigen/teichoic acid export membrane protein